MEIEPIRLFVRVVQAGGFSHAARQLGIPTSTVSRALGRLETESGTHLLIRTTRRITLTDAGRQLYEAALEPIRRLEAARRQLQGRDDSMVGRVRITAPDDFGAQVVSPIVAELMREFDGLSFELNYTNQILDLVQEAYDFALRIGPLAPSGLKARRLGEVSTLLVAAPEFLRHVPRLETPRDLAHTACVSIVGEYGGRRWTLHRGAQQQQVEIHPRAVLNQMVGVMEMALAGIGVALLPLHVCRQALAAGRLERVLSEWRGESVPLSIVSPLGTSASGRLRLVAERLGDAIHRKLDSPDAL